LEKHAIFKKTCAKIIPVPKGSFAEEVEKKIENEVTDPSSQK